MWKTTGLIFILILIYFSLGSQFYNQPNLSRNATWPQIGIPYPYTKEALYQPRSIFVDKNDTVYVSFDKTGIVIVWSSGNETPSRIYNGDNGLTNLSGILGALLSMYNSFTGCLTDLRKCWQEYNNRFDVSNSLFVTSNGDIYVGKGDTNRIVIWTHNGSRAEIPLENDQACYGLFVDINDTIYCSLKKQNQVIAKSIKHSETEWSVRAEKTYYTTFLGKKSSENLRGPYGIFVDINLDLYVVEYSRDRIQLFKPGDTIGETIIENGNFLYPKILDGPTNIVLDAGHNFYIVDGNENRVVFVAADFNEYRCLVGCSSSVGSQMKIPTGLSFDSSGNLLVSDTYNDRVLKFRLENNSCNQTTTTTTPILVTKTSYITETTTEPTSTVSITSSTTSSSSMTTSSTRSVTTEALTTTNLTSTANSTQSVSLATTTTAATTTTTTTTKAATKTTTTSKITTSIDNSSLATFFVPPNCPNSSYIGTFCNVSMTNCDSWKPCQHSGICTNDLQSSDGYYCTCLPDFTGPKCDTEIGPCKPDTCLHDGICIPLNGADFYCNCTEERTGTHCDRLIDYCHNVTCLNKGRCRSVPPSYRCDCLSPSYSGLHCEHVVRSIVIRQYVSKSFGYVVIIALCTVLGFIIIMDILKYCFGIDPVHKDREFLRRRRAILERKNRDSQKRSVQTRKY